MISHDMITTFNNAWVLLDKYYNEIDETPANYSAIVLQPKMKQQWFQGNWPE
jgi:hypothetical protein